MTKVYDRDWYASDIADPDTGEPVRFTGGSLHPVDFELDALWYGVAYENQRRTKHHEVLMACLLMRLLMGDEYAAGHRLDLLDTTAWLKAFDVLWEPYNIPTWLDPQDMVNFRLDVLRAMATLPKSYRRVLTHAMDGYNLEEIADLMGWTTERWGYDHAVGSAMLEVPNTESAERVVRKASSQVRASCSLFIRKTPKPPEPTPDTKFLQAGDYTTDVITRIEEEIQQTRAWRQRELRRRAQQERAA